MIYIIAPHCDDEIIGTYSVVSRFPCTIVFVQEDEERLVRAEKLKEFNKDIEITTFREKFEWINFHSDIVFAPDPNYEMHPLHRKIGNLILNKFFDGYNVYFYTTNMNTPYTRLLHPVERQEKKEMLDKIYPDQSDLWKYEWKYFMYEGIVKYTSNLYHELKGALKCQD